ncbi:c-type cytochrome [Rhizobium sp. BK376]|uniref:c-type cytochrome n=1 Tax=Rhizobium sp. BK376 TaxID=2512149 RepID=UPI001045158B|nr:c-type cytochrome [Rhizobium sp. BK376]TCR80866.1 cytochrome c553 [Rhizobium sp. BK376]
MSDGKGEVTARGWTSVSVGITAVIFLAAGLFGFVVFPNIEGPDRFASLWDSICSAAGLPRRSSSADPVEPTFKISQVALSRMGKSQADAIGRGATLALQCAICHGPTGVSRADSPNLAGQYAAVIYKQLHDFKSGARSNAIMSPFSANLSDQDINDLAAYYAYLPTVPLDRATASTIPAIVGFGAPMRGIAPCGSCHGSIENKPGSPWLGGQPEAYIISQLNAFSEGARTNDTSQQMRNIARRMSKDEIAEAAKYYASQKPEGL